MDSLVLLLNVLANWELFSVDLSGGRPFCD